MAAPSTDERWFVSPLSERGHSRRVLAGTHFANRLVAIFHDPEEAEAAVREHNDRLKENGPAEAATSPSRGPINPSLGTDMNGENDTTAPALAPAPYRLEAKHPEKAAQIRATGTHDLTVLADAFGSGIQGLLCILNQPRCGKDSDAFNWVEEEMERLGSFREMIFDEIRHRPSDGERDHEEAIRKLLAYDLDDCGDGFMDAMATMSRMVAAHNEKRGEIKRAKMGLAA